SAFGEGSEAVGRGRGMIEMDGIGGIAAGARWDLHGQGAESRVAAEAGNTAVEPGGGIIAVVSGSGESSLAESGIWRELDRASQFGRAVQRLDAEIQGQHAQRIGPEDLSGNRDLDRLSGRGPVISTGKIDGWRIGKTQ